MGVRSGIASTLVRAAKAFGPIEAAPQAMRDAAENVSQMGPDHPFSPGEPVGPYDGYSRAPRTFDYQTSYNVATRPRTHERVSFDTLRGLIESYDVAQICIHHRIDSLRSLDWKLIAEDSFNGDVQDAVAVGMAALRRPDRVSSFETWFAKWMYDVLAYDAGCLYRLRNRAGRCVGLAPVDGSSIAPLLDYWGNSPAAPAEAYVQYANGVPWNWLTRDDLIYEPFRPRNSSPYGHAPLESVILNANTDIRFQVYFLQRFTEGNIPEAFASAPEGWSPEQVEQFQGWWDSFMYGEQSAKHQIKWMPGGSTLAWSNEKDFTDAFSLFLMRKSAAAYHVVPSDLGFTETVNLSSSESQSDVQHRIGDLPLGHYAERILTSFLQDDLGLPLQFAFDWGEEQDDRVAQANADDVYAKLGVVGVSELREMRFGLPEPQGQQVPRFVYTTRAGPIPLSSLMDVAGPVDEATGAPVPGSVLPHKEFQLVEGVVPVPPPPAPALAERLYGPGAVPPALPAPQAPGEIVAPAQPVAKEGATAGITSATGVYGYDGPGSDDDDEDDPQAVAKEMAAFRRFERARRKAGTWRDFEFRAVAAGTARRLNTDGRSAVLAEPVAKAVTASGPKAPDRAWPGWDLDGPATAYWAALIAAAIAAELNQAQLDQMAAAYLAEHPDQQGNAPGKQQRNDAAAAWLLAWLAAAGIGFSLGAIAAGIVTDAWLIGAASAAALLAGEETADTGGWQPGQTGTAQQRLEELGAATALGAVAGVLAEKAADAITKAYTGALSRILAGADGDGKAADLARELRVAVADPGTVQGAVQTQVTTIAGNSGQDYYAGHEVDYGWWMTDPSSNVCPVCLENEAAGRVPLGDPYPSGDRCEPAHPLCRCAVIPERPELGAMP